MMTNLLSSEETAVVEIYSTRRDATIALEYLNDEGLDAFISADDAGGLHPQLQQTHGVKLLMLATDAAKAREKLRMAHLLNFEPDPVSSDAMSQDENQKVSWVGNAFLILAALAIAIMLLMTTLA